MKQTFQKLKTRFNSWFRSKQGATPAASATTLRSGKTSERAVILIDVSDTVDQKTIQRRLDEFEREGNVLVNSVSKNGEYKHVIDGKPPVLRALQALGTKTIGVCTSVVEYAKAPFTHAREELEATLGLKSKEERRDYFLEQNGEAISAEVAKAEEPLMEAKTKKAEMETARNRKEEAAAKRQKIANETYGGYPPDPTLLHGALYWCVLVVLFIIESLLNYGALDSIDSDLNFWAIGPTSLILSGMIALAAHFTGSLLANKSEKALIWVVGISGTLILGIVFWLRMNGLASTGILTLINVSASLLTAGLSYLRHRDDPYFQAEAAFIKWQGRENRLQKEIDGLEKLVTGNVSRVYDRWNAKAARFVEAEVAPLEREILRQKRAEEALDNYLKTKVLDKVQAVYQELCVKAEINFVKARQNNDLPETIASKPTDVPVSEAVKEAEEVETYEAEEMDDEEVRAQTGGYFKMNGAGRAGDLDTGFYSLLWGLILFGFTACATGDSPQHTEALVIGDGSIKMVDSAALPSPAQQASFLLGQIGFPYGDPLAITQDAVRVRITQIGETSFPVIQTLELASGGPLWSMVKTKRRKEQALFSQDLTAAIKEATAPMGLPSSYVFDCLCQTLPALADTEADQKIVLIISDMLEYSEVEDFYTLAVRLAGGYGQVVKTLELRCPALHGVDLSGISITAVYLPDSKRDKATRAARQFWSRYIQSKGGVIEFLPNLPAAKPAQAIHH